jgi:hypothetical protein
MNTETENYDSRDFSMEIRKVIALDDICLVILHPDY